MSQENEEIAEEESAEEDRKRLEFADGVELATTKDELWSIISDPETLTECVPGAQSVERLSEREYELDIERGVSSMTLSLTGEAEFVEMNPPDYIVTTGYAFGSKTGSEFDILAAMEMTELDAETVELAYTAEVEYSGGVASIPKRVLTPIVKRDVNTYFDNVRAVVETDDD